MWGHYYRAVQEMGWPDSSTVASLAPTVNTLRFREQLYRERINYRPGEGFEEIYLAPSRYQAKLKLVFRDTGIGHAHLGDAAYAETMASERLLHVAALLSRLRRSRLDKAIEEQVWQRRRAIIGRYGATRADRQFGNGLLPGD